MPNQQDRPTPPRKHHRARPFGLRIIMDLFDVGPLVATTALLGSGLLLIAAIVYFVRSAAPTSLTISTGPMGSSLYKDALKYSKTFERTGVTLKVLTSEGSSQNLQRLEDPSSNVDIAMVQVSSDQAPSDHLISLGSIAYQPLLLFYRGAPIQLISELKNKKIAIGAPGSGARNLALDVLHANGIDEKGPTQLLDWEAVSAAKALLDQKIDAAFVMSESASTDILHDLLHSQGVHLYSYRQADAYSRKMDWFNVLTLPQGIIDLGQDIPAQDLTLKCDRSDTFADEQCANSSVQGKT